MKYRKRWLLIPGKSREVSNKDDSLTQALREQQEHNSKRKWWQPKVQIKGYVDPWKD